MKAYDLNHPSVGNKRIDVHTLCYYYHTINICKCIIDLHQNILDTMIQDGHTLPNCVHIVHVIVWHIYLQ